MFNVCPGCGEYSADKQIEPDAGPPDAAWAVCRTCGHRHRFLRLPLFFLTGASGAGKTTVALELLRTQVQTVVLDSDLLWNEYWAQRVSTTDGANDYRDTWLRLAKNIAQAGRPVCIVGGAIPERYEASPEHRYFSSTRYLALHCDPHVLRDRLAARPAWRDSSRAPFLDRMVEFNNWLAANAAATRPPMAVVDTTRATIAETARAVTDWLSG